MNATPKALKLAGDLGLDPSELEGTGKNGRLTVRDVRRAAEPTFGVPPTDLDPAGRRVWMDVKAHLEQQRLWSPVFGELLSSYVRSLIGAAAARDEIKKSGKTTRGSQGQLVVHPAVKIRRDYELDTLRYAGALLITPEALQKHKAEAEPPDEGLGF